MKKFLLPAFLLLVVSANAQISFGVKGGINFSYARYIFDPRDLRPVHPDDPSTIPGVPE